MDNVTIQLGLNNTDGNGEYIAVIDRIRSATFTFIEAANGI